MAKNIIPIPCDSYEHPLGILLEEMDDKSNGQTPIYIMDHIPGTYEAFEDGMVYACDEPFTIQDIEEWYREK